MCSETFVRRRTNRSIDLKNGRAKLSLSRRILTDCLWQKGIYTFVMLTQTRRPSGIKSWTYDELQGTMAETNQPTELWEGELIMSPAPAPHHQRVVARLFRSLDDFVSAHRLGEVYLAPIDVVFTQSRTVQPDLIFISRKNEEIIQDAIRGVPDLVMEVVSKGSWRRDRVDKKALYEQFGVKEYWIIDPEAGIVELFSLVSGAYRLLKKASAGETVRSKLLVGFKLAVDDILV
jgi:Uma2 family endonuclease